jgi:hypothetical protein
MNPTNEHIELKNTESLVNPIKPNDKCAICAEDLITGSPDIYFLQCLHKFHMPCITKWLAVKQQCPVCKFPSQDFDIINISEDGKYESSSGHIIDNGVIHHNDGEAYGSGNSSDMHVSPYNHAQDILLQYINYRIDLAVSATHDHVHHHGDNNHAQEIVQFNNQEYAVNNLNEDVNDDELSSLLDEVVLPNLLPNYIEGEQNGGHAIELMNSLLDHLLANHSILSEANNAEDSEDDNIYEDDAECDCSQCAENDYSSLDEDSGIE